MGCGPRRGGAGGSSRPVWKKETNTPSGAGCQSKVASLSQAAAKGCIMESAGGGCNKAPQNSLHRNMQNREKMKFAGQFLQDLGVYCFCWKELVNICVYSRKKNCAIWFIQQCAAFEQSFTCCPWDETTSQKKTKRKSGRIDCQMATCISSNTFNLYKGKNLQILHQ